jgi:uroporphyrin-III C-methyltransferase/precorrin-2 dehydrogenase/sirohydrochlorin ferrochelatase
MEAGLARETTVAVVENASRPDRRLFHGVLDELPALEARDDLAGPVMVIIGDAVAGANFERSEPLSAHRTAAMAQGVREDMGTQQ